MHVKSGGIYIDEIELVNNDKPAINNQFKYTISDSKIIKDSSGKLEQALRSLADANPEKNSLGQAAWSIERVDCFDGKLGLVESQSTSINLYAEPRLKLRGQLCLKLEVSNDQTININAGAPFTAYKIHEQLLRNGKKYHDALLKINPQSIAVSSNKPEYLWIDFSAEGLSSGYTNTQLTFTAQAETKTLAIGLQKLNCEQLLEPMDLTVWAYSKNSPIWNTSNKQQIANLLIEAGVNNITIHPNYLPNIKSAKIWTAKQKQALADELNLYQGNNINYLLVTSWKEGRNYFVDSNGYLTNASKNDFKKSICLNESLFLTAFGLTVFSILIDKSIAQFLKEK